MKSYIPTKIFNVYFLLIWLETFALQLGQNIFNNLISVYVVSLGYTNTFAGSLAVPYMILAVAGRLWGGYISDVRGRRPVMVIGCAAFALGAAVYSFPVLALPVVLVVFRALHGFGYAAASTASSAAVADVTPENQLSMGVGINWTAQGVAQLIGGVVIVVLAVGADYRPAFLCGALCCMAGAAVSALCGYENSGFHRAGRQVKWKIVLSDIVERKAFPNALVVLVYYLGLSVGTFFIVSLSEARGIDGGGFYFTACAIGMISSNVLLVKIAERIGRLRTLLPVFAATILCNLVLSGVRSFGMLMLAGVLYGISVGAMPVIQSATIEGLSPDRRGAGTSTLFLAMDLSMGVGPAIWGLVIDSLGFGAAYLGAAIMVAAASVLLIVVFKGKHRR